MVLASRPSSDGRHGWYEAAIRRHGRRAGTALPTRTAVDRVPGCWPILRLCVPYRSAAPPASNHETSFDAPRPPSSRQTQRQSLAPCRPRAQPRTRRNSRRTSPDRLDHRMYSSPCCSPKNRVFAGKVFHSSTRPTRRAYCASVGLPDIRSRAYRSLFHSSPMKRTHLRNG